MPSLFPLFILRWLQYRFVWHSALREMINHVSMPPDNIEDHKEKGSGSKGSIWSSLFCSRAGEINFSIRRYMQTDLLKLAVISLCLPFSSVSCSDKTTAYITSSLSLILLSLSCHPPLLFSSTDCSKWRHRSIHLVESDSRAFVFSELFYCRYWLPSLCTVCSVTLDYFILPTNNQCYTLPELISWDHVLFRCESCEHYIYICDHCMN